MTLNSDLTEEEHRQPYESYPLLAVYWGMVFPFALIWIGMVIVAVKFVCGRK